MITRNPTRGRGPNDYLDMPHILLFCTLRLHVFLFELIKDWNVPNPL